MINNKKIVTENKWKFAQPIQKNLEQPQKIPCSPKKFMANRSKQHTDKQLEHVAFNPLEKIKEEQSNENIQSTENSQLVPSSPKKNIATKMKVLTNNNLRRVELSSLEDSIAVDNATSFFVIPRSPKMEETEILEKISYPTINVIETNSYHQNGNNAVNVLYPRYEIPTEETVELVPKIEVLQSCLKNYGENKDDHRKCKTVNCSNFVRLDSYGNNNNVSVNFNMSKISPEKDSNLQFLVNKLNESYLKNKYHFVELFIYYSNFFVDDLIDKDSFIISSTVKFVIIIKNLESLYSNKEI